MKCKKGFTLIELLVVISIISLLMAILLPALGKARDAAMAIKCASNLRGLGIGVFTYAENKNDYYPPARGANWPYFSWVELSLQMITNQPFNTVRATMNADKGIGRCPVRLLTNAEYAALNSIGGGIMPWINYGYNYVNLTQSGSQTNPKKRNWVEGQTNSGSIIFATDSSAETGNSYLINSNWPGAWPSDKHNNGANVLWVDGHVTRRPWVDISNDGTETIAERQATNKLYSVPNMP